MHRLLSLGTAMNSTLLNYYYYYLQMHKWLTKVTTKVVKKRYEGKSSNETLSFVTLYTGGPRN
jgi:hypothetical protein